MPNPRAQDWVVEFLSKIYCRSGETIFCLCVGVFVAFCENYLCWNFATQKYGTAAIPTRQPLSLVGRANFHCVKWATGTRHSLNDNELHHSLERFGENSAQRSSTFEVQVQNHTKIAVRIFSALVTVSVECFPNHTCARWNFRSRKKSKNIDCKPSDNSARLNMWTRSKMWTRSTYYFF